MRGVGCARLRRAGAGESGERRSGQRRETAERRGARAAERDRGRETASPMVLHCGILWERR